MYAARIGDVFMIFGIVPAKSRLDALALLELSIFFLE
jgi:hypothetical protein